MGLNIEPKQLRIRAGQEGDTYIIRLIGELDVDGAGAVEIALLQAERTAARRILLDLHELIFVDSTGLAVLMRAERRSEAERGRLRMTNGTGHVAEMLRLTGLDLSLPLL